MGKLTENDGLNLTKWRFLIQAELDEFNFVTTVWNTCGKSQTQSLGSSTLESSGDSEFFAWHVSLVNSFQC